MKDTFFCSKFQLNFRGKLLEFDRPVVMGILNLTPDSFYSESRMSSADVLTKAGQMLEEGVEILDVGGYSSRPGADDISVEEEKGRIVSAIERLKKQYPEALISIDTFRSEVARAALDVGADMVNDISGGQLDEQMFEVVAKAAAPYVLMHMKGTPQTMKKETSYEHLMNDLQHYFSQQLSKAKAAGIKDIIIDPGFGFAKTVEQNFEIIQKLEMFHIHNCSILVGISRKSMIYKTLDTTAEEALNGTTILNAFALNKGAGILRVHDVKEAVEAVKLMQAIYPVV